MNTKFSLIVLLALLLGAFTQETACAQAAAVGRKAAAAAAKKTIPLLDDILRRLWRAPNAIPKQEIDELTKIAMKPNGMKKVGPMLNRSGLSIAAKEDILLTIAIGTGTISFEDAQKIQKLSEVDGLLTVLPLLSGADKACEYLEQLNFAVECQKRGHKIIKIEEISDIQKGTALQILLSAKDCCFALRNYSDSTALLPQNIPNEIAGLKNALANAQAKKSAAALCFAKIPPQSVRETLKKEKIEWFAGSPEDLAQCLNIWADIL